MPIEILETVAPTIAEIVEPTVDSTIEATVPRIMEVLVTNDHSAEFLSRLDDQTLIGSNLSELGTLMAGILVFFLVVVLCHYSYKFFRIFF